MAQTITIALKKSLFQSYQIGFTKAQIVLISLQTFTTLLKNSLGYVKLGKILKNSLDSIPSHSRSAKIQISGRKVCLRC